MQQPKMRCSRCHGRKKIYKSGSSYSLVNFGGKEVTCPFCNGEGIVMSFDQALEANKEVVNHIGKRVYKRKD